VEAAEILIKNQLAGIKMAVDAGIVVKINTVMVPASMIGISSKWLRKSTSWVFI
jgi:MoaA/NifB/PqqE/SkfB family radical SAM enzyme